jgi:hypothetical protein
VIFIGRLQFNGAWHENKKARGIAAPGPGADRRRRSGRGCGEGTGPGSGGRGHRNEDADARIALATLAKAEAGMWAQQGHGLRIKVVGRGVTAGAIPQVAQMINKTLSCASDFSP